MSAYAIISEILNLQLQYSSTNTPEMQRRGELVRHDLPDYLSSLIPAMAEEMGPSGDDLACQGRDATGPKSEIPWVRIYSRARSPNATSGWYVVLLFAGDGAGFFLSLGHGSTTWDGGQFKPRSDEELRSHVAWARMRCTAIVNDDDRILDAIDLRFTRSKVADSYERGTVCAYWYDTASLPSDGQLVKDLLTFVRMLSLLYDDVDMLRSPDGEAVQIQQQMETIRGDVRRSGGSSSRQGYGLNPVERRAVELRAMALAKTVVCELGYMDVRDTSANSPYDFTALKDGCEFVIEVKGTTGLGKEILLTVNEVEEHISRHPNNVLIVVHSIELNRRVMPPIASGGQVRVFPSWKVLPAQLKALTFAYALGNFDEN